MHEQVRTLARLVEDLFELARIDAGSLSLELREAELDGLVQSCVRGVEAEAQLSGGPVARGPGWGCAAFAASPTRSSACSTTC